MAPAKVIPAKKHVKSFQESKACLFMGLALRGKVEVVGGATMYLHGFNNEHSNTSRGSILWLSKKAAGVVVTQPKARSRGPTAPRLKTSTLIFLMIPNRTFDKSFTNNPSRWNSHTFLKYLLFKPNCLKQKGNAPMVNTGQKALTKSNYCQM